MTKYLGPDSALPPYMAYPRFLLGLELSETAKLVYILLLDRARVSMKNEGWTDEQGHVFIYYTIEALAQTTGKCAMTIKDSLKKLEDAKLIHRRHQGAGKPSRIYVLVQTENCMPEGQHSVSATDRNLATSNKKRVINRSYDCEEGESL